MRNALRRFKNFLHIPAAGSGNFSGNGPARISVVNLNQREKDFVNWQTQRMLLRKQARQFKRNPQLDWTASLPMMPRRGCAYALYNAK